jgi:2-polyprenyl-3-methyl-5-hydroxy-6-metoxy-1,4-benzoquinol methylase
MPVKSHELNAFVEKSDALGGPGHPETEAYWADFSYEPTAPVDVRLPSDSSEYFSQMIGLYEEISARKLDQKANELTKLDVARLAAAESPYTDQTARDRTMHYLRIAKAVRTANLIKGAAVLDMGCGWGLSSELLAQFGFHVSAVDINPLFTELVRRRAARLDLKIDVTTCAFEEFSAAPEVFDAVLFYECFHHAVRPTDLLRNVQAFMKPAGKLILAGEPIQATYWPEWGLRLDALSVYCIRKFGWFESGWSASYLEKILLRNDLLPVIYDDADPTIGKYVIASKSWSASAGELAQGIRQDEWWVDSEYLVSNRTGESSTIVINRPHSANTVLFELWNFSPLPIDVGIELGDRRRRVSLANGCNQVRVNLTAGELQPRCIFKTKSWCPAIVLGTSDVRNLGFHLKRIEFES